MALIQADNNVIFLNTNTFTLTPPINQSYKVKYIQVYGGESNYLKLYINKTTVGYWRTGGPLGSHLYPDSTGGRQSSLIHQLYKDNLFAGYPVVAGQNFVGTLDTSTAIGIAVYFDVYDAGDLHTTDPNGSDSTEYQYIQYIRASTVGSNNNSIYDTQITPLEFPAFPVNGAVVPAGMSIKLLGLAGTPVSQSGSTSGEGQFTEYIKFVLERSILYDPTKNGLNFYSQGLSTAASTQVLGGVTEIGNQSSLDQTPYYRFENPLTFTQGQELDIYLVTSFNTLNNTLYATQTEIALILDAKKVS
jgi:hypothetical protein